LMLLTTGVKNNGGHGDLGPGLELGNFPCVVALKGRVTINHRDFIIGKSV
jgi:hypothetical protein